MMLVVVIGVGWIALLALMVGMFHAVTGGPTPRQTSRMPHAPNIDEATAATDVTPPDPRLEPASRVSVQAA